MVRRFSILLAIWAASAPVALSAFLPTPVRTVEEVASGRVALMILGAVLFGIALVTVLYRIEQTRRRALQALADSLGFTFHLRATAEDEDLMAETSLWKKGHGLFGSSSSVGSILAAPATDDLRLMLFEFSYVDNAGDNTSSTIYYTVARMDSPLLQLPKFVLEPASLLTKAKKFVGFEGIDFANNPSFTDACHLASEDKPALRRIFQPAIIHYCEEHPGLTIEAQDRRLFVYRQQRMKADLFPAFLEEAKNLLGLFVDAGRATSRRP